MDDKFFDADGVANTSDAYPFIAISGLLDTDSDGAQTCDAACTSLGMAADTDDDGDGVLIPLMRSRRQNGNAEPTLTALVIMLRTMGDGVADTSDAFPLDSAETIDTDGDGIGNNADAMMTEMALLMPQTPFHLILQKRWTLMLTALVTAALMMTATVLRMAR